MNRICFLIGVAAVCSLIIDGCEERLTPRKTIDNNEKQVQVEKGTAVAVVPNKQEPAPVERGGVVITKTITGDRLLYNGDGSYTLFVGAGGKERKPVNLTANTMHLLVDAPEDQPIFAEYGGTFVWGQDVIWIHIHNIREIGGGIWHSGKGSTPHQVSVVE